MEGEGTLFLSLTEDLWSSRASMRVGRKGMSRLAQMRLAAVQASTSACWTSGP